MTEPQYFLERLNEIKELYVEVKEAIILAENFDPSHEVYLSPINELRNALDHIMRSLIYEDKLDNELNEAKEHLYRAGYDAYEVMAINVGSAIIKGIEEFDASIISTIYPTYYTDVKPRLIQAKVDLADTRAHKRLNPETGTKSFTPYKEKISNLIKQLKICTEHIPALQAERKKRVEEEKRTKRRVRRKWVKDNLVVLIIGIIAGALGIWAYETFLHHPNRTEQTQQQSTDLSKQKK